MIGAAVSLSLLAASVQSFAIVLAFVAPKEFLLVLLAPIPPAALLGALYGPIAAPAREDVVRSAAEIARASSEVDLLDPLRRRLVDRVRLAGTEVSEAGSGEDFRLEVALGTPGLGGDWGPNPDLFFVVPLEIRLVRAPDGVVIYLSRREYRSGTWTFTTWGAEDARRFRRELQRLPDRLAEAVVDEVLLLRPIQTKTRGSSGWAP